MTTLPSLLLIVASLGIAAAQGEIWRVYSPPKTRFSMELPASLTRLMSFEGEHGANLAKDQEMKGAACYAVIETTPAESQFGVIVIDASKFARRTQMSREDFIEGLSYTFIADDDETQFLREPVVVKSTGLSGKEYVYARASENKGPLYLRGRIFDTGNNFYVLVYVARDESDLSSREADRFFNSFRVRGQKRIR